MKRRLRVDPRLLTSIIVAILFVGMYAMAISAANRFVDSGLPESTTFSAAPEGIKVYYRYLGELGLEPKTLEQFDTLPAGRATVIIAANRPLTKTVRPEEARTLAAWVKAGGRVVFAGAYASDFTEELGVGSGTSLGDDATLQPALPSIYVQGVDSVRSGRTRIFATDPEWAAVLKDQGGIALGVRRVGAGEVVWLADAYPITNEGIAEADNARLGVLLAAGAGGEIWFDEYHHGFARGGGVIERIGAGGQSALLLFVLGLALLLAAYSRRLGPPIQVIETPAARTMAYIDSLAALYRKAGAHREALVALEDGLTRALARRYGSPVMGRARHATAAEALDRAAGLHDRENIPTEEFVTVAGMIARARREVEGIDD